MKKTFMCGCGVVRLCAVAVITLGVWCAGCTGYWTREPEPGFHASAGAAFLDGSIRGYLQTPEGRTTRHHLARSSNAEGIGH
jgi:hypothetical protein